LHDGVGLSLIVADSALYTAKTLQDLGDFPWIMRVPETIGGTRELILAASGEWMETRPERAPTRCCVQVMATLSSAGWWFIPKVHASVPNKRSTTRLSLFERPLVYGEYPVSQVAKAHYGADDDHDPLSFNLRSSGAPHPANAPTAPTNVSHQT
jgi:hypothetical protein